MAVNRRTFLKNTAAATAATVLPGTVKTVLGRPAVVKVESGPNKWRGRVAINFNKNAVKDLAKKEVDSTVVTKMVDDTIKLLSGKSTVGEAWKEIFPSTINAESKIAIKTNFYALPICPAPEVLLAIVQGLREMTFDGTAFTGDITIYEANTSNTFAQAKYDEASFNSANAKLLKATIKDGSDPATGETQYAAILDQADFLINVFSARGHNDYTEGFSLGFKSHYGTYINQPISTIHSLTGYPQRVRNLQCTGVISKKQVLSVSCAFFCNNEGDTMGSTSTKSFTNYVKTMDPEATCESPSTIIMSTDAISCEMQAIKLLRLNKNPAGNYGVNDMPKYLRASGGVSGALSDKTYDIGEIDESKMDVRKIINDVVVTPVGARNGRPALERPRESFLRVTPLRGQKVTHFEFKLPSSLQNAPAHLTVHDLMGRLIFSRETAVCGILNHFSWNQRATDGSPVAGGKYVGTLKARGILNTVTFSLSP